MQPTTIRTEAMSQQPPLTHVCQGVLALLTLTRLDCIHQANPPAPDAGETPDDETIRDLPCCCRETDIPRNKRMEVEHATVARF